VPLEGLSMPGMSMREFCETLYCAQLPAADFAVTPMGVLAFVATSTENHARTQHRVSFTDVREFTRIRDQPSSASASDLIELSVIELERTSQGWRVWLNPWYLEEIAFHCAHISLDGEEVSGEGRWFQDALPKRGAV
jgi:hypothetical protein